MDDGLVSEGLDERNGPQVYVTVGLAVPKGNQEGAVAVDAFERAPHGAPERLIRNGLDHEPHGVDGVSVWRKLAEAREEADGDVGVG